jgi:PAS domain S-box-containing protein
VTELSRYHLEVLRKDDAFVLYRGQRREDASRVLVLSPSGERPSTENLRRLEHEYSLREALDPAWAIRPIAVAWDSDRILLEFEDPGGVPLDQLLGNRLEVALFLHLAVSLSAAIDHLHERGIIHKDIKPANVLVNPVTGQCWLMGFGIASRLPRERQPAEPPEFLAGTLAYMAPEQTGRMNRCVDCRSDLYALGVTLYEMLTGSLPFAASDPMEWIHCHIARKPVAPTEHFETIPPPVSAIIMKLLAKTAEERYQTAAGAESDLQRCLAEWENGRAGVSSDLSDEALAKSEALPRAEASAYRIEEFPLGEHDTPDRLLIPEKLYGRAHEIETLLASFDRIVAGTRPELVLVSGYSGIGKSSVVNELQKVLVQPRALFASGKFDQYKRDIPYATLAQAFQVLIRFLLSTSETELQNWRHAFGEALGPNGRLIVDLVPELKLIIGEQPPVTVLPPKDAQARFQLVFRRFIGVFARREHPLALFLDDLQWLDSATLDLLEDLLSRPDIRHLMLIGAYRDNEVNSSHPLMRKLEEMHQAGAVIHQIVLAPLSCEDLERLFADSLHCESIRVAPLAQLVHQRTAGNPFFATQFITALAEEDLLRFDHASRSWVWDVSRIGSKGYTDNVVDLMLGKLNRLPIETQKALKAFACLGNSVEISTLAIIHERVFYRQDGNEEPVLRSQASSAFQTTARPQEQGHVIAEPRPDGEGGLVLRSPVKPDEGGTSEEKLHLDLWEALRLEFIVRSDGSYKFVHDRVQETAYSLIPEELRATAHLQIGRELLGHTTPERREGSVFEIVNQLNRGAVLISSPDEREQLAELNLIAGKRAKASTAFASALNYLAAGASLLDDSAWDRRHDLVFALELPRAECEFLTGQTAAANERLKMLSSRAIDTVELAAVTCLRIDHHTAHDQIARAVDVFLDYFRRLGVEWSRHPTEEEGRREYQRIWSQLGTRTIEELVDLPLMADLASLGTLDVLSKIYVPAVFTDANLLSWTVCYAVNLSLERGNSDASCLAYVWLGKIAGAYFGDHEAGMRFGQLSQELAEKRNLKRFQAQTYLWFAQNIAPLTNHLRSCRELISWAFESATKSGDITTASYSFDILITNLLAAGDPLIEAQRQAEDGIVFSGRTRHGFGSDLISGQLGLIRTLRGLNEEFGHLDDGQHSEAQLERHCADQLPDRTVPACWYWIRKLQARFFSGNYVSAVDAAEKARPLLWSSPANFETVEYHFFSALSHAALSDFGSSDEEPQHLEIIVAHHRQLETWVENCPENFVNRAALVGAEIARIEGRILDAMDLYEQAIRSARANGFVHNEALANEVAARFYAARGFEKVANAYLRDARYGFLRWGANGKVRQLDYLYPQLRVEGPISGPAGTIGAPVEHLDLATVLKVSQAVSAEIVLEKLIDVLIRTAIEHAGADRGALILSRDAEQWIEAEATTSEGAISVHLRAAVVSDAVVPESIVHYVMRTQESVILDDASTQNAFSFDPYIRQHHARSILCIPLINQAKLIGLLYLENSLTPHVFTPARLTVLKLLASQAAISLENTRLYRDLEKREAKIRRLVDANIFGVCIWDFEGRIIEANGAFLRMLNYSREDLVAGRLNWRELTPPEWRDVTERGVVELTATGILQPYEKEYFRNDRSRVPVLVGSAVFEEGQDEGVSFVLDLSQQKRAEDALTLSQANLAEAQAELAHVTRVTALGELAASIAHEISQPVGAIVTNADASLRWLSGVSPDLDEARESIRRITRDGKRAGNVISRLRSLFKKTGAAKDRLDLNEVIEEVVILTQSEARRNKVVLRKELAADLPPAWGDRVQLQQVLFNLILNAIEAMASVDDRERVLLVTTQRDEASQVRVTVQDSGIGFDAQNAERIFNAFHTTKASGMGMGLSISRSIVESHGGRLWATLNDGPGATFQFTI